MPRFLIVAGPDRAEREEALMKLIAAFSSSGYKTGVAIHRTLDDGGECSAKRFSSAGAAQVLITRGKETALRGKQGGLTPLKRIGARYFNAADILLASGYYDPLPRVEACLSDDPSRLRHRSDPALIGVIFRSLRPRLPIPAYPLDGLSPLVRAVMA